VGRTSGHVGGYFPVTTLPSNHREIQYSQLSCTPALIATGFKASIEYVPINSKEAEEYLFGSASDGKWVSNGVGGGHYPYGAVVSAQGGVWKRNGFLRWVLYAPYEPWVWAIRTLLPTTHQWLSLSAERADHSKPTRLQLREAPGLTPFLNDRRQLPYQFLSRTLHHELVFIESAQQRQSPI